MPVIFATDAPTASGHSYRDLLGKEYEFPHRYRALVASGDRFLYYRGSRAKRSKAPGYFGCGLIESIDRTLSRDTLTAQLSDVVIFETPAGIRSADGVYLETGSQKGTNWANGVRRISAGVFASVLDSRAAHVNEDPITSGRTLTDKLHQINIERYSVDVAIEVLSKEFEPASIIEMPPGNPGFDLMVVRRTGDLHIEVKGTTHREPRFHLSEGQRQHAAALRGRFRLVVVHDIDLQRRAHRLVMLEGPLDESNVALQAKTWIGEVLPSVR